MSARKGFGAALAVAAIALGAVPALAGAAVLHDQNSGGDGTGFFSQPDTDSGTFSELADDFTVPDGQSWTIDQVDVTGHYDAGTGPVSAVDVRLYSNSGANLPDSQLFEELGIIPLNGTAGPSFSIPLTGAPALSAGAYWVSVQAIGLNYPGNIWDWDNRAPQVGSPAAARTSFLIPCLSPNWAPRSTGGCGGNAAVPDQMFSVSGTASTPPPTTTPPGNPTSPVNPAGNIRKRKCKKKQKTSRSAEVAKKKKCTKKKRK